MTDIKEIAVDVAAIVVVAGIVYSSIVLVQVSDELKTLSGAAAMYLFSKYTPNSV